MKINVEEVFSSAIKLIKEKIHTSPLYAEIICQQLLKAFPDNPEGLQLLGIIKQKFNHHDQSIEILSRAISINPENADNYNNIALSYANLGFYEKSIENLEKAIKLKQNYLYYNNLALQYRQLGVYDFAIQLFEKAIELNSNDPQLWNNLGGVYGEMRDLDNAERCFNEALKINPEFPASHVDLAFTYHLRGDWKRGFEEYEWRFKHFSQLDHYRKAYDSDRLWNGTDSLVGKTILLYGEQGLGDVIQFSRYIKYLKKLSVSKVILHCQDMTQCIMNRIEGVDETVVEDIVNKKEFEFPEYDYQCGLMSLPYLLKKFEISGSPYLKPLVTFNIKEQSDYSNTFNVGLVWAGSPAHPNDSRRSIYLREFKSLQEVEGVKLFNLQFNFCKRIYTFGKSIVDYAEGCEDMKLVDLTQMIENFEDTATILTGLDLLISVDTAIVHLAGALGVPCWMLVPYNPDWRWGLNGDNTPWYDSVRIFRQKKKDDWQSVIEEVKNELTKKANFNQE